MFKFQQDQIVSIVLTAELMMYGNLSIRIIRENDKMIVNWFGTDDGGTNNINGQKEYVDLKWPTFINSICALDFPKKEGENSFIVWEFQLISHNTDLLYGLPQGLWDPIFLERIVNMFEVFLEDDEPLAQFKELLNIAG